MECVTPGRYNVTKLPESKRVQYPCICVRVFADPKSAGDNAKCKFCRVLLGQHEEIEVYKANHNDCDHLVGAWDVEVIQIQAGLSVSLRSLSELTTHSSQEMDTAEHGGALSGSVWLDGSGHILLSN